MTVSISQNHLLQVATESELTRQSQQILDYHLTTDLRGARNDAVHLREMAWANSQLQLPYVEDTAFLKLGLPPPSSHMPLLPLFVLRIFVECVMQLPEKPIVPPSQLLPFSSW